MNVERGLRRCISVFFSFDDVWLLFAVMFVCPMLAGRVVTVCCGDVFLSYVGGSMLAVGCGDGILSCFGRMIVGSGLR